MTSLVFMLVLHLSSVCGEPRVLGLQELTRDILQRIKAATGHPIDTNRFVPILAASTRAYQVLENQPSARTNRYLTKSGNRNLDQGHYSLSEREKDFGLEKDHFFEIFQQERDGNELSRHEYEDEEGESRKYNEEKYLSRNHHGSDGGRKNRKSKKGRKRGKFRFEKGFRDIYHKDEEKKSDFFWNNQHEEGKWLEYGFKNRKHEKSKDKGGEGKHEKDKSEEWRHEKKEDKCTKCKT